MIEWKKYDGTDEQIAEMMGADHGWIAKFDDGEITTILKGNPEDIILDEFEYLICNPHPLADMIIRQAQTGQPVWIRCEWGVTLYERSIDIVSSYKDDLMVFVTDKPDWNIPGAEYRFTPFED